MIYRALRAVNQAYPFVMLWAYLGLFLLALPFMFIFPPLSLLLVILGAVSVPFVLVGRTLMVMPQHMLARRSLSRDTCPRCGEEVIDDMSEQDSRWHCVSCGTQYTESGEELEMLRGGAEPTTDHEARLAV